MQLDTFFSSAYFVISKLFILDKGTCGCIESKTSGHASASTYGTHNWEPSRKRKTCVCLVVLWCEEADRGKKRTQTRVGKATFTATANSLLRAKPAAAAGVLLLRTRGNCVGILPELYTFPRKARNLEMLAKWLDFK